MKSRVAWLYVSSSWAPRCTARRSWQRWRTVPGFSGTRLAKATYGEVFSHVHTIPARWQELIWTKGSSDLYVQQNTWDPATCQDSPFQAPAGTRIPAPASSSSRRALV